MLSQSYKKVTYAAIKNAWGKRVAIFDKDTNRFSNVNMLLLLLLF